MNGHLGVPTPRNTPLRNEGTDYRKRMYDEKELEMHRKNSDEVTPHVGHCIDDFTDSTVLSTVDNGATDKHYLSPDSRFGQSLPCHL